MVLGVRCDGTEVGTAPPEEAGEVEVPIAPGEALMESTPALVDALEVGQIGGGTTEVSPADMAMAWTSEPELPASFAPEGAPVMEEVPSAPIGLGLGPPGPLSGQATIRSHGE